MANSPQTGTQAKESKMHFKITVKMLRISQNPWAACKTWSSNKFFSAAVLKQRKRPQLKSKRRGEPSTSSIILTKFTTDPPIHELAFYSQAETRAGSEGEQDDI